MIISLDLADYSVPTLENLYSIIQRTDPDAAECIRDYLDNLDN